MGRIRIIGDWLVCLLVLSENLQTNWSFSQVTNPIWGTLIRDVNSKAIHLKGTCREAFDSCLKWDQFQHHTSPASHFTTYMLNGAD